MKLRFLGKGRLLRFHVSFAAGPGSVGMAIKMRSGELYIGCVCAMYALGTCCTMYALRKICAMFSIDQAVAGNCTALHAWSTGPTILPILFSDENQSLSQKPPKSSDLLCFCFSSPQFLSCFFLFSFSFSFFPFFFWCSVCEPKSMLLDHATDWPEDLTCRAHQNRRSCIPGSCTLSILRKWNCSSHWKAGQKAPCYLF